MKLTFQAILIFSVIFVTYGASHLRQKRQFNQGSPQFDQQGIQFGQFPQGQSQFPQNQDPVLVNGQFVGFGKFRPNQDNPPVGNGLTIGAGGRPTMFSTTTPSTTRSELLNPIPGLIIPGQSGVATGRQVWSIGSAPSTTTTQSPITARPTPSQAYLRCLSSCPSTMEYNPVCGSDDQNYHNMQRLICANRCGNNVQMVRLGTCLPL